MNQQAFMKKHSTGVREGTGSMSGQDYIHFMQNFTLQSPGKYLSSQLTAYYYLYYEHFLSDFIESST